MIEQILSMLFWPAAFAPPNALRAAGDANFTMGVSMISMWFVRIGMSYLLAEAFGLGAMGARAAMTLDWVVRSVAFVSRFALGRWKTKRLV